MFRWWNRQTSKSQFEVPTTRTEYPYGLCIRTEAGYFLIREKCRFRIPTERTLQSWRMDVLESSEAAVAHLKILTKVGFRDGTIIMNIADGKSYLISHNKKRHIQDPDIDKYGLNWDNTIIVSEEEANLHEDGEVLN